MDTNLIPFLFLLPLAGFIINGLFGKRLGKPAAAGVIATIAVGASFVIAVMLFAGMLGADAEHRTMSYSLGTWLAVGNVNVGFSYVVDQLSIIFILVITGVGTLIHLYSIGYMKGDEGFVRFFVYLNLFIVMMLQLVMSDNFLLTFLGWEGVGLCSYLLIGFWFGENKNADAAKKAFIVNRIGDFGFLAAMGALLVTFGSLNYAQVSTAAAAAGGSFALTFITMMLFLGCTGKSAQIPLFIWLPDAMAGPTPVSALIHAATMVTSGIYLIARTNVLFALSPATMTVVTVVAVATALLAALIGIFQNDIKKVLAYSTVSQLGFMFIALGVGAFTAGVFHVMTHAFFKACLFLGSGAVIHAMHHEQDIQKMGGLKKYLPVTFMTFLLATLAIAGIPPFAGFFSKDEILWIAFSQGSPLLWVLGAVGALMTAFYMFRLVYLTFYGTERFDAHHHPPHEVGMSMRLPLIILAALSVIGGFVGIPEVLGGGNAIHHWLEPILGKGEMLAASHGSEDHTLELILMAVSVCIAIVGILTARKYYLRKTTLAGNEKTLGIIYRMMSGKFYIDEIYEVSIIKPIYVTSKKLLFGFIDVIVIDGIVNGSGVVITTLGTYFRKIQTGIVQNYAVVIIVAIAVAMCWILIF